MPRWVTQLHAWVYRRSHGRFLGRMGGQPVLLLQTTGRRSGRTRTTPVQYLADGDTFVVVASDAGAARPPAWYLNLRADAHAQAQVGSRTIDVRAHEATGQERAQLWQRLTAANRYLERAARKAARDLPLMTLAPTTPQPSGRPSTARDHDARGHAPLDL
jgi:deazaflavin-dependent oxidoreductase (nitroreductase family)